jgi:hypothetical protein
LAGADAHVKNTPSGPSIEEQIEACWLWLLDHAGRHEFWLTVDGKLRHGPGRMGGAIDIGTFDRRVSLSDFREQVFDAYGELKAAIHGAGHG